MNSLNLLTSSKPFCNISFFFLVFPSLISDAILKNENKNRVMETTIGPFDILEKALF